MGARGHVTIVVGDEAFTASADAPFVFGRADAAGVIGLDPADMGISAQAGSVELMSGIWWIVNRSRKRRLLVEEAVGLPPQTLECQDRHAITVSPVVVLVPGVVYTHRLEISVPQGMLSRLKADSAPTTGTLLADDVRLSDRDRDVLTAMCSGYLKSFPHRDPRPLTYQQMADLLGSPWTRVTVRKQIERFRERLGRIGVYFDGARANDELADYLINNRILAAGDLARLPDRAKTS